MVSELFRAFQRFLEVFRGFQKFSEVFRGFQRFFKGPLRDPLKECHFPLRVAGRVAPNRVKPLKTPASRDSYRRSCRNSKTSHTCWTFRIFLLQSARARWRGSPGWQGGRGGRFFYWKSQESPGGSPKRDSGGCVPFGSSGGGGGGLNIFFRGRIARQAQKGGGKKGFSGYQRRANSP